MKYLTLLISVMIFSIAARSADLNGYIVMANNDTVKCKIRAFDFNGVTVIHEQGNKEVYRSKDEKIIAYGYFEKGKWVNYSFLNVGSNSDKGFYQRLVNGPKYRLFGRAPEVQGGNFTYLLFKPSGELLKFDACSGFCPWRKKLREFLSDDSKAEEAIDKATPYTLPLYIGHLNRQEKA